MSPHLSLSLRAKLGASCGVPCVSALKSVSARGGGARIQTVHLLPLTSRRAFCSDSNGFSSRCHRADVRCSASQSDASLPAQASTEGAAFKTLQSSLASLDADFFSSLPRDLRVDVSITGMPFKRLKNRTSAWQFPSLRFPSLPMLGDSLVHSPSRLPTTPSPSLSHSRTPIFSSLCHLSLGRRLRAAGRTLTGSCSDALLPLPPLSFFCTLSRSSLLPLLPLFFLSFFSFSLFFSRLSPPPSLISSPASAWQEAESSRQEVDRHGGIRTGQGCSVKTAAGRRVTGMGAYAQGKAAQVRGDGSEMGERNEKGCFWGEVVNRGPLSQWKEQQREGGPQSWFPIRTGHDFRSASKVETAAAGRRPRYAQGTTFEAPQKWKQQQREGKAAHRHGFPYAPGKAAQVRKGASPLYPSSLSLLSIPPLCPSSLCRDHINPLSCQLGKAMVAAGEAVAAGCNDDGASKFDAVRTFKLGPLTVDITPSKALTGAAVAAAFAAVSWQLVSGLQAVDESSLAYANDKALTLALVSELRMILV
ncbi:unnamed protein product [Closterium sp. NIES-54]